MSLKQNVLRNIINSLAVKTNRKLVIIESDDWGAIRMPSKEVYDRLLQKNLLSPSDVFAKYDSLASEDDFIQLFETIQSVKDYKGNHPIFTANCAVANPDFEKIETSQFQEYHYESIEETYKRYPRHKNSFQLWKEGVQNKFFHPQYHCREHVNVPVWMEYLRQGNKDFLDAFTHQTYAINQTIVAALMVHKELHQQEVNEILSDGYALFKKLWGFESQSFIAPNYTWNNSVEETLLKLNIRLLQGSKRQNVPVKNGAGTKGRYHFTGQQNKAGQIYLVRNCLFEPSISPSLDYVRVCLHQIENAFYWNTPAIVGSHRLNYIGFLEERNRIHNLKSLKALLNKVVEKYPEVEFVTTDQLGKILVESSTQHN